MKPLKRAVEPLKRAVEPVKRVVAPLKPILVEPVKRHWWSVSKRVASFGLVGCIVFVMLKLAIRNG